MATTLTPDDLKSGERGPRATELLRDEYDYAGSVDVVKRRLRELRLVSVRPARPPDTGRGRCYSSIGRRAELFFDGLLATPARVGLSAFVLTVVVSVEGGRPGLRCGQVLMWCRLLARRKPRTPPDP
jgi:hypothetical protein